MSPMLDGTRLNGPHVTRISARPTRTAFPLEFGDLTAFRALVELECQLWGGGASILVPLDQSGAVPASYLQILPGSQMDYVHGTGYDPDFALSSNIDPKAERHLHSSQLAIGLLPYRNQLNRTPVEVTALAVDDPWRDIYLACLGSFPEEVDPRIRDAGRWLRDVSFNDFATINRLEVRGSVSDLLARTWPAEHVLTPRQISMLYLSYGGTASTALRSGTVVLPQPRFTRHDAGPNVVVVCSPGSTDDLAMLWNLRAAHGDHYAVPIGIPASELTTETLRQILGNTGIAHQGMAVHSLYVTSASISAEHLSERLGTPPSGVTIASAENLLTFGTVGGWVHDEVLVWEDGKASYKQLDRSGHSELLEKRNMSDSARFQIELAVEDSPLPLADDYRVSPFNGSFYNGAHNTWTSLGSANKIASIEWPSKTLIANSLASVRGLQLRESAPGIAARILIERLGGIDQIHMLSHGPLLVLLESMAARQGFPWYKDRMRQHGLEPDPTESVGGSTDELPEKSFHDFKRVFNNSEPATRYWLSWAEKSSVVIKGFPVQCPTCGAKQWIPVSNFAPPITCRGCAVAIQLPFGDRPVIDFKYRLSEQVRRVYESDAMGHLLVLHFFKSIFERTRGSDLIGLHPGMSVLPAGQSSEIGEADVLMLTLSGDFIPIEVKRSAAGLTEGELRKLDALSESLRSPWNAVAACHYAREAGRQFAELAARNADGSHRRIVLSYDALLDPRAMWGFSSDPFALEEMSEDAISDRESEFVQRLSKRARDGIDDWLTYAMTRRAENTSP